MLHRDGKRMGRRQCQSVRNSACTDGGRSLDEDTLKPEGSYDKAKFIISLLGLKL